MILGLLEWAALPIGTYFIGAKQIDTSIWFFLLSAICYIAGYELAYITQHMIIRIELQKNNNTST
jgi:4-hydroxybenzoate polyprenyltransferase